MNDGGQDKSSRSSGSFVEDVSLNLGIVTEPGKPVRAGSALRALKKLKGASKDKAGNQESSRKAN